MHKKHWPFIQPDVSLVVNIKESVDAMERALSKQQERISPINGNIKARSRTLLRTLSRCGGGSHMGRTCSGKYYRFLHKIWRWWCRYFTPFPFEQAPRKTIVKASLELILLSMRKSPTADGRRKPGIADEVALGVTYNEIDDYLEGKQVSPEAQAIIEKWWYKGQHKNATCQSQYLIISGSKKGIPPDLSPSLKIENETEIGTEFDFRSLTTQYCEKHQKEGDFIRPFFLD